MDASSAVAPPRSAPKSGRSLHRFANPGRFLRLSGAALPYLAIPGLLVTIVGLAWGLFFAPADWQHKNLELVLAVNVVDGRPGPPRIVASYFW